MSDRDAGQAAERPPADPGGDDTAPFVSGKPVAFVLALVLVGAAVFKWWPSDDRAVRRQLDALADVISVPSSDTDLSRQTRLNDLRSYFAEDAHLRLGRLDVSSRDALVSLAEAWTPPEGGLFVEFVDEAVTLPGDGTARVALTAKLTTRDNANGGTTIDSRPTEIDLEKRNGDWVITGVLTPAGSSQ